MNYSFLPEAKKEFDKSATYYENIHPELGEDFFEEFSLLFTGLWPSHKHGRKLTPG